MPLMFLFGRTGFGKKSGTLHAKGKVPITMYRFGIFTVFTFSTEHTKLFSDFMEKVVDIDQFIIENAPAVRNFKKKIEAKSWIAGYKSYKWSLDRKIDEAKRYQDLHRSSQEKIEQLEGTIKTLVELKNNKGDNIENIF